MAIRACDLCFLGSAGSFTHENWTTPNLHSAKFDDKMTWTMKVERWF